MSPWGIVAAVVGAVAVAVISAAAAPTVVGSNEATGTLDLNASLSLTSTLGGCQPVGSTDECGARTIEGLFPGLGRVTGAYSFLLHLGPPLCPSDSGKALAYPIRLVVAGKGEIDLAVAEGAECEGTEAVRTQTQAFRIVGGSGRYSGASGSGTLERTLGSGTDSGRHGQETWRGTLNVPGLDFDLTPPTLTGAMNRTVKARRGMKTARVVFRISAADDQDGSVRVTCTPQSGSRFRLGRTRVRCTATDGSANTVARSFTVSVKARR